MAGFQIVDCASRHAPGRMIRRLDKLAQALLGERLAAIGIGYAGWATLKLVLDAVAGTAGELGRELGYSSGATTRLIDGLEGRGLIARDRDDADRRVVRLRVTPAGRAVAERGVPMALGLWNELVADLDQTEADRFMETLAKLLATIERKSAQCDMLVVAPEL